MANSKQEIRSLLRELRELTALDEQNPQSFRVRAYENAIHGLENVTEDLSELTESKLVKIKGVGKSTAKKIREYFDTGSVAKLVALREKFPPDYVQLSRIPGLGAKSVARLRSELGVENLDGLKEALETQKIRELKGFGAKSEEKISRAIERLALTGKENRAPIAEAMPIAEQLVAALESLPEVLSAQYCGSLRRQRETIGDIDILVASTEPAPVMSAFVALPQVGTVLSHGETKSSMVTASGIQVDLRVVEPDQMGAAMLYFTGSKSHNIKLRQRAMAKGWLLNEYGLLVSETEEVVASKTEADIYRALELPTIPAPMREDTGELEAADEETLPTPVVMADLRGDLHTHTSLSGDGRSSLEDMLAGAQRRGYGYIAFTDHAENLAMNGVSREKFLEQRDQLAIFGEVYPTMKLLHGCELNIGPDGGLDYDEEFRMTFDWCVAAVHSHFDLDQATQTKRVITAMQDPAVNVIGHLTGRMIGRRPGIEIDVDAILQAAVDTNTAIEINSALPRLDAATEVLRRARELGVIFVISSDSHHVDEMRRMEWGARQAQRGWVDRDKVANTWSPERFLAWAAARRGQTVKSS